MSRQEVQELFGRARDAIQTSQRIAEQLAISEKRAGARRVPPGARRTSADMSHLSPNLEQYGAKQD